MAACAGGGEGEGSPVTVDVARHDRGAGEDTAVSLPEGRR
jgi:hypothetical protein